MDARLTIEPMLGLKTCDAHIIRNAGGIVTDDALRSLIVSHHLLGTREFIIVNHTDCGMLTFKDEELRNQLHQATGTAADVPAAFHAFSDLDENVRQQIRRVRSHPWIPKVSRKNNLVRSRDLTAEKRRRGDQRGGTPGEKAQDGLRWMAGSTPMPPLENAARGETPFRIGRSAPANSKPIRLFLRGS